jgi:predicted PurR-regulated permease PerM
MNDNTIKKIWAQLNNAKLVRYILLLALGWGIFQIISYFATVIVVFIFAAILVFLLSYPVRWSERFLPHGIAVIIVFLLSLIVLLGLIATLGFTILSQAQELLNQAPQFLDFVISILDRLQDILTNLNLRVDFQAIEEGLRNQFLTLIGTGFTTIQGLLFNFIDLILIAVVAFFMLLDGQRVWNFILKIFPSHYRHRITLAIQQNFLAHIPHFNLKYTEIT